jgi:hypothetical protein
MPDSGRLPSSSILFVLSPPRLSYTRDLEWPCPWRPEGDGGGATTCPLAGACIAVGERAAVERLCSGALSPDSRQRNDGERRLNLLPNGGGLFSHDDGGGGGAR